MYYCPGNVTVLDIWVNNGISQCFMDTITPAVLSIYMVIFGLLEWREYWRHGTEWNVGVLPKTKLFILQLFLSYFLIFLAIVEAIVNTFVIYHGTIYAYSFVYVQATIFIMVTSTYLIHFERYYVIPSRSVRGHSVTLLVFWTLLFASENIAFVNLERDGWWFHLNTIEDKINMIFFIARYACCLLLFILGLKAPGIPNMQDYINLNNSSNTIPESERQELSASAWSNVWRRTKILAPFLWPKKSFDLQFRVILCFSLLIAGRFVNILTPIYTKKIVDSLSVVPLEYRWDLVLMFVAFKFLQGGGTGSMGLLNNLRSFFWIRVQQYTSREVKLELFRHLHSLSLRWHLSRKTGEVLRVMDRGTDSINGLLSLFLFQIFPTFIDITVAIIYFISAFNGWFGLIVFVTMLLYLAFTVIITEMRTKYQRLMNLADNKAKAKSVDSLLNFETVKYYGAEEYEVAEYRKAILSFQDEQWKNSFTLNILNSVQNVIISGGLLFGSLLCVYQVVEEKTLTVGDYVLYATYLTQLYMPLNWFGTFYRQIQNSFVDMECMFDLLGEQPDIRDSPGALPIEVSRGQVEFRNVTFSYLPERTVLKNLSFLVEPGKTVALVGPSGSGKTTIIRLLFRFYDANSGFIFLDGQNIQLVTQESLRKAIGVVPQDTVLFNNTIKYNIQYGKADSSDREVVEAAKNADIHERILTFPDLYNTQVGERGLKLSGGEKQRVAIARTFLKSPMIVLLDEATSSLDTLSERNIQASLAKICSNRTTIIVAHRLSTIIHADEIMVLKNGEICERGRHQDLINMSGLYSTMWQQQLENDSATKPSVSIAEQAEPKLELPAGHGHGHVIA
ncbi:ATP-binding cassette sub-family B member 6 [Planococcus citri]|uniref:ATP-binding cassette sub-family B member 6 n=1 Tax=Planococcus citri TaxID=170843 RepID=UPI0031F88226